MKKIIWHQFGAAIDMLENAVIACPDDVWGNRIEHSEFWYITFHALFYLDLYLSLLLPLHWMNWTSAVYFPNACIRSRNY
jgi:hypothetical protein